MAVNQTVNNLDMEEEQPYTVGMLYGYNIASYDRYGQCKYVGMSELLDNRINEKQVKHFLKEKLL